MAKLFITLISIAALNAALAFGQETAERGDGTMPLGAGVGTEASDGTLPLRLLGDGTLPLRLTGAATGGATRLDTQVVITQAAQRATTGAPGSAIRCQLTGENVSKHATAGTITVGDASYAIRGICYDHASRNLEIVAERQAGGGVVEQSFMLGVVPGEQLRNFSGRLTLTGAAHAGHYNFDVRSAAH